MAKERNRNREPVDSGDLLDEVFDAEGLNPALQRVYSELGVGPDGTDVTVHVTLFRKDGKEARVWSGQPDDYDLMEVARAHGSGDYRVKLYVRTKSGHMVPATGGNRVFPIQLTPAEDAAIKQARENPGATATPGGAMTPDAIRAMVVEAVRAAMPQQPVDSFAGVKQVAEIVKMLAPQPAPVSPLAGINLGDVIKTVFGMAGEVAKMRQTGGGGDTPRRGATTSDVWVRMVEKFGEPLLHAIFAAKLPQGALPAQPAAVIDAPAGGVPAQPLQDIPMNAAPVNLPPDLQFDEVSLQQLRFGIAFLQSQAIAGHDPETYADVVLDQLEKQPGSPLERILDLPDPFAFLLQIAPDIEGQRAWFTQLINALNEEPDPAEVVQH